MQISKLIGVAHRMIVDAAGADGLLTKTEAKKLPVYLRDRIEAVRPSSSTKLHANNAFEAIAYGQSDTFTTGLRQDLVEIQKQAGGGVKGPSSISAAERKNITAPGLKDVTDRLWAIAESANEGIPELSKAQVDRGAKLLTDLLAKLDNGDQVMTTTELSRAKVSYKGDESKGQLHTTLWTAINRASNKGSRDLEGIANEIELARKEIHAGNTDGKAAISGTEQMRANSVLGEALRGFIHAHKDDKVSDFKITPEPIYVPSRPFRAPYRASAGEWLQAAVKHFNSFSNDNKGAGADNISRYVMGEIEAKGIAKEVAKLSPTFGKSVMKALEERVQQGQGVTDPQRIYLTGEGQTPLLAVAKDLSVKVNLQGDPRPPSFDYY